MKILATVVLLSASSLSFAMAGGGTPSNPTMQATELVNTVVANSANGPVATAQQNLASNVGTFTSSNTQLQAVGAENSYISNSSSGTATKANQNIASNAGTNGLYTTTYQIAIIRDSFVTNQAGQGASASQNISSNTNCITCN